MASGLTRESSMTEVKLDEAEEKTPRNIFTDSKGNLKFVNAVVAYPFRIFFFVLACCMASIIILSILNADSSPFTEDSNEYNLYDKRSIAYDTLNLAVESVENTYTTVREEKTENEAPIKIQEEISDTTIWIYEAKTREGLFTKEALPIMRDTEMIMTKDEEYPNYCQLEYRNTTGGGEAGVCKKPLSVTNIFYASQWNSTVAKNIMSELEKDGNVERYNTLAACVVNNILCSSIPTIDEADKAWVINVNLKIISMMQYWDGEGDLNQNVLEVSEFLGSILQLQSWGSSIQFFLDEKFTVDNPVATYSRSLVYWGEPLVGSSEVNSTNKDLSENLLKKYIVDELLDKLDAATETDKNPKVQSYYFMGALIFDVILKILTTDGLKAVASFLAVFFYLRLMIGSWFLATVGMIEIVMSLPLAWLFYSYIMQIKYFSTLNVLCIFIVMAIGADDIFVFMDAYKQSAHKGDEVLKSLESRISWVYRRSGHAMAITSATTCSAFLCTLISPLAGTRSFGTFAAFVIFFDYVLVMTLYCTSVVIYHDYFETKNGCCNCTFWSKSDTTTTQIGAQESGDDFKPDRVTIFFKEKFSPFILNPKYRFLIAIPMTAWIVLSSVYSSKLEPTTTEEQFLAEDHPLQKGATILTRFPKSKEDDGVPIYFIWGLQDIDRSGVNQLFDPDFIGNPSFVENFEFNEACQSSMLEACEAVKTDKEFEEFIKRVDGIRSVDCFIEEFGAYNVKNATDCEYLTSEMWKNETWQVSPNNVASTIELFSETDSCYASGDSNWKHYSSTMGWDGKVLRYAGFSVESSVLDPRGVLAEDKVRLHYDKFFELKNKLDASMEKICHSSVVMTDLDQKFVFMNNQKIYRKSALTGSMLGVAIAFVVLLVSTRKLHIAFLASVTILLVLISVTGAITMLGWTLGTIEAILISILAGFSVDYTVHLAHAYTHAEGDTEQRVEEAFGDMGISVFSGMLTSVVASIPLFFCQLTFFAKFGTFLCLTIVFSWIFANLGFMSMLAQLKIRMSKETKEDNKDDAKNKDQKNSQVLA